MNQMGKADRWIAPNACGYDRRWTAMSREQRGRVAPTPPPPFPGKAPEPAGAFPFPWNAPRRAINPKTEPEPPRRSALANLLDLYAADNRDAAERREAEIEQVWRRYFFNDERDPELRDFLQSRAISRTAVARELHRNNPALLIIDNLRAQPKFISGPMLARIEYLQRHQRDKSLSRYLDRIVVPAMARVERVRAAQMSAGFKFMAGRDGLDALIDLPALDQKSVKRLATLVAAHIDLIFIDASDALMTAENVTPDDILRVYRHVADAALRLDVVPPAYRRLCPRRRRGDIPYDLIPGAIARLRCAAWWYRKLWQMRCEWREEQLRAACLVNKHASPYISAEAVIHKREQRRRALEFFRAHELVNEGGDVLDMEDVINASASNPAHRRNEMMACVKGLELIAEMRGDCAVFYTITCPSKYHATLSNGLPNPAWSAATVRQSSDYLVGVFAAFRKALHRAGLRWYGMRVAEPHHDGTVHWHMLCFMRKRDRRKITALLRKFAIREDRAELGKNTAPRFKAELINPRKGSPTSYIAKYVSKNIDGRGLSDVSGKETGKSLRETAEHVTAWASLHRVQQFRFFGIPSRQAYRELRLLAGQHARTGTKPGAPVLADPRLDAVLAAADVGCFATYITKQGGVLIPRDRYLIRTAYEQSPEANEYGDRGIRIYGVWSPLTGPQARICTHPHEWKKRRKSAVQAVDLEATADSSGPAAAWTRGNNCRIGENSDSLPPSTGGTAPAEPPDFATMTRQQRREMLKRIRDEVQQQKPPAAAAPPAPDDARMAELITDAKSLGWSAYLNDAALAALARSLAGGGSLVRDGRRYFARGGTIFSEPAGFVSNWWRVSRRRRAKSM